MKVLNISGSSFSIGEQLGLQGKDAWHNKIKKTDLWHHVWEQKESPLFSEMMCLVQKTFPEIWQEILGLAKGLDEPVENVFLWNCRGDVLSSTSDGCTTIVGKTLTGELIVAHNEDGLPELIQDCFLVNVQQEYAPSFFSFAYPASLCGHTFSVNQAGIINTVNNLRVIERLIGYPRQVLARASLNELTVEGVLNVLTNPSRVGAFHHLIVQKKYLSLELLGTKYFIKEIKNTGFHANHIIYDNLVPQIITKSSKERQNRLEVLLNNKEHLTSQYCLQVLSDQAINEYPIYRTSPFDSDHENTIATAIFTVKNQKIEWEIFQQDRCIPTNKGEILLK